MAAIATVATTDTIDFQRLRINDSIARWNNLGEYNAITITGGSIEGTTVGLINPVAGSFTNVIVTGTIDLSASTCIFANNQLSGNYVDGGVISNVMVELSADPTVNNQAATKYYVDQQVSGISNIFKTIAISGQTSVVADAGTDTLTLVAGTGINLTTDAGADSITIATTGLGALAPLNSVTTAYITNSNVTYAKLQNVSATDKILGRATSGAGIVEEIDCTSVARTLLAQTTQSDMRTTGLGLGTATTIAEGIVELATSTELGTGTDNSRAITPLALKTSVGFSKYFESGQIPFTSNSAVANHGLGVVPKIVSCEIVCKNAVGDYSVGDRVPIYGNDSASQGSTTGWFNNTQIGIGLFFYRGIAISLKYGNGQLALDTTNWEAIFKAWA